MEEEYTVQDLVHKCGKIWRASPDIIEGYRKALEDGSMNCPVCTYPNGSKRSMTLTWVCTKCRQTCLDSDIHLCFCKPKHDNVILKIAYPYKKDQSNPELTRRNEEINLAKTQRILAARVEKERNIPLERQQRIEVLLQKLVDQGEK